MARSCKKKYESDKGKPAERQGRKAAGLKQDDCHDSRVTEEKILLKRLVLLCSGQVSFFAGGDGGNLLFSQAN